MHELRFVGIAEDGDSLVLTDDAKTRYILKPTDEIRTAIRRDRKVSAEGAASTKAQVKLRPRDVQGLIRGGVPLEEIAERAGWTLEKVERYEGPIRAERDYVSGLAQAVVLPSRHEQTSLRERADRRLADRGVEAERVVWDSWKSDDTFWTVVCRFPAGGRLREATWQFDPVDRTLRTMDDEARWLGGDELGSVDIENASAPGTSGARFTKGGSLKSAKSNRDAIVYDVEAEGGLVEAEGGLADAQAPHLGAAVRKAETPAELTESMRARQASRGRSKARGSRSATATGHQAPDVDRVQPLDLNVPEPPHSSHPRPQDLAEDEEAAAPLRAEDSRSGAAASETAPEKSPDSHGKVRHLPGSSHAKAAGPAMAWPQPTKGGAQAADDDGEHDMPQEHAGNRKRSRNGRRGGREVVSPVRSALLPEEDSGDDELFDELPGFHDGGEFDIEPASVGDADAPGGDAFSTNPCSTDVDDADVEVSQQSHRHDSAREASARDTWFTRSPQGPEATGRKALRASSPERPQRGDAEDEDMEAEATSDATSGMDESAAAKPGVNETVASSDNPPSGDDSPKSARNIPSRPGSSKRSGRPSVPSWDDIMFGGGRGRK